MGRGVVARAVAAVAVLAGLAGSGIAGAEEAGPGMRVYRDPQTGRVVPERPPSPTPPPAGPASTSHEGLVEKPLQGGGAVIDLGGRFQSPLAVTRDADGRMHIGHAHETH